MEPLINAVYLQLLRNTVNDATEGRADSYRVQFSALAPAPADMDREAIPQLEALRDSARQAWNAWKEKQSGPFWAPAPVTDSKEALTGARLFSAYLVRAWTLEAGIRKLEQEQTAPSSPAPRKTSSPSSPAPSSRKPAAPRKTSSPSSPAPSSPSPRSPAPSSPAPSSPAPSSPAPSSPPPGLPIVETEETRQASAGGILFAVVAAGAFLWFMLKKKG